MSFPSVSPFPSSETNSPKNQSKRSAPKASRNGQPQKPVETISPKSQATRSAPKANRHDQPQKPGNTISPKSQVLGAQGRIFAGRKPRICALFARASGHQISSMVSYLREHLGIRAPLCPRTDNELFRSNPPYGRANFGGSPRTKSVFLYSRSRTHRGLARVGDDAPCRSDPTFTRASPGLRS